MNKKIIALLIFPLALATAKRQRPTVPAPIETTPQAAKTEIRKMPQEIKILQKSYTDLDIKAEYSKEFSDWILTFRNYGREYKFFWCNGSVLPEEELEYNGKYWSIFYEYPKELRDPASMTEEEKERLSQFSSRSNRKNDLGSPMFFFDAVYESDTRQHLESHLVNMTFLGKNSTVHERIKPPLQRVNNRILEEAKTNEELKIFVEKLKSCDGYNWRLIDGTKRKSFHSLGCSIDMLPKRITGEIFWSWAKDKNPSGWMLTPLSRRWIPHSRVIQIFEEEGFVWGGKWAIWDNMHFEYHPELLMWNERK